MDAVSAVGDVQVRGIGIVGSALGLRDIGSIDAARWTGAWRAGVVMSAELLDGLRAEDSCEQKKREKQRFKLHQFPPSVVSVSSSGL